MKLAEIGWRRIGTVAVAVAFLIVFAGVLVTTVPQVAGADHSFVVFSDSMSPTINAGSVVVVSDVSPDSIERGDVITYVASEQATETTRITHRVVDIQTTEGQRQFRTKGDANDNPDNQLVAGSAVIGVVQFHIPYLGYLIDFAGSPLGLVALVVVPALLLAVSEAWALYRQASGEESG